MMRWTAIAAGLLVFSTTGGVGSNACCAQQTVVGEFLEASSPLKTGGAVTTLSIPGGGISTRFSPSQPGGTVASSVGSPTLNPGLTANGISGAPAGQLAQLPGSSNAQPWSPVTGTPMLSAAPGQAVAVPAGVPSATVPTASWTQSPGAFNGWSGTPPMIAAPTAPQVFDPYASGTMVRQIPTLGFTPSSRYRNGNGWNQAGLLPGNGAVAPPAASLPPSLGGATPWSNGSLLQQPPQVIPPGLNGTGQGPAPLIKFQNMPPGSYLGQGIVGQPKAYVDGQPIRNLLRYFFPW